MDFLKNNRRFDLLYGGVPFAELACRVEQTQTDTTLTTVYTLEDGLRITNVAKKRGGAYEWVNWFENTSDHPSQILSEVYDACVALPMPHEDWTQWQIPYQPEFEDVTAVYAPTGSSWRYDEFSCTADSSNRVYDGQIWVGKTNTYSTSGGRSSEQNAPFFNLHKDGKGYVFAIGWTGQWNCSLLRNTDDMLVKTKIEDTHFRLLSGEKIRTSSFVVMPYEGTVEQAQNQWRRLVREQYSLIGREGRDACGPLCACVWGGMKTQAVLERVKTIQENRLPIEYVWMDAGWYGADTQPTADDFEGDWGRHTGDWQVSPYIHTNGLKDVSDAVHRAGMKFLLWFEPERVIRGTPLSLSHPEYFLYPESEEDPNLLLDLGNEEAWNTCFHTLAQLIGDIGVDCYRQDFNMGPLSYWRRKDTEDRQGISEIKHIMGMYRLWDALLEKFPHLIIDNCSSGGHRIDIETLRRSVPLWRSDYQCLANYASRGAQCHHLSFNTWMPFSGTGTGRLYDTYHVRSAYSPAFTIHYTLSERETFGDDPDKMAWLRQRLDEYIRVRPYLSEDFYPLTQMSDRLDVWSAAQFDRPAQGDGILQIFRRERSPYETACFTLRNVDPGCDYVFTDADTGDEFTVSGAELAARGLCIDGLEKRSSKIYFYQKR